MNEVEYYKKRKATYAGDINDPCSLVPLNYMSLTAVIAMSKIFKGESNAMK